jgi:hypothetical protein
MRNLRILAACVAAALGIAGSGASAQAPRDGASAQAPQDGAWALEIHTQRGACEPLYRYYIVIEDQAVHVRSAFGDTSGPLGQLRADGRVDATLGQSDDPVSVKGRLGASSGAGTWSAPARRCAGRWSAYKRA